jgi:nitrite reductase (NADH) small subunit
MIAFVRLAQESELPPEGEVKEFPCGDKVICVANVNGTISAMDNVCLHRGGPLGQGTIEGGKVVCPWHGWHWDPKTGQAVQDPNARLAVYPIKIENEDVMVAILGQLRVSSSQIPQKLPRLVVEVGEDLVQRFVAEVAIHSLAQYAAKVGG